MIPASPEKARVQLQAGVLPTDPAGLRSSIPPGTLLGVTVSGGKATVNLAPIAQDTVAQEQVLLFGQMVMTLTEQRGVGQVEFLLPSVDGAPQTPDPRADRDVGARRRWCQPTTTARWSAPETG